jgi:hypothetical protein
MLKNESIIMLIRIDKTKLIRALGKAIEDNWVGKSLLNNLWTNIFILGKNLHTNLIINL